MPSCMKRNGSGYQVSAEIIISYIEMNTIVSVSGEFYNANLSEVSLETSI